MIKVADCNPACAGLIPAPISISWKARLTGMAIVLKTIGSNPIRVRLSGFPPSLEGCQRGLSSSVANRMWRNTPAGSNPAPSAISLRFSKAVMHDPVKVATEGSNPSASAIAISSNGRTAGSGPAYLGSSPRVAAIPDSSNGRTRVFGTRYGGSNPSSGTILRAWYIGRAPAFQAREAGSSPAARSIFKGNSYRGLVSRTFTPVTLVRIQHSLPCLFSVNVAR